MKQILLTTCVLLFVSNIILAQRITINSKRQIGVSFGFNQSSFSGASYNTETNLEQDYKVKKVNQGLNVGFNFQHNFNSYFSLKTDINWISKIGEAGDQQWPGNNPVESNFTTLQFLTVPFLAKFDFGRMLRINGFLGPYAGILLKAKNGSINTTNEYESIEYGVEYGAGLSYDLVRVFVLEVNVKNQIGMKEIYGGLAEGVKTKSWVFSFGVGFKI